MKVCQEALVLAEQRLSAAKEYYRHLPPESQETIQVDDTDLPELMENAIQANNDFETASTRNATNQRYLDAFLAKRTEGVTTSTAPP